MHGVVEQEYRLKYSKHLSSMDDTTSLFVLYSRHVYHLLASRYPLTSNDHRFVALCATLVTPAQSRANALFGQIASKTGTSSVTCVTLVSLRTEHVIQSGAV